MTTFLENLWTSIFTPGPTSTLLLATNVSFGALQIVLLALLIATYSIHFLVLSVLSAGLWWSINWFAVEVSAVRAKEEEEKRVRRERGENVDGDGDGEGESGVIEEEGEKDMQATTTPGSPPPVDAMDDVDRAAAAAVVMRPPPPAPFPSMMPLADREQEQAMMNEQEQTPTKGSWNTSMAARLAPGGPEEETTVRKRQGKGRMAESLESVSTDSEWEKVEEVEGDL